MVYPITAGDVLEAIREGAREGTAEAMKQMFETGDAKVQLTGHIQEFAVSSWDEIAPNDVPAGSVAILIGTNDIRQTDGEEWLPI